MTPSICRRVVREISVGPDVRAIRRVAAAEIAAIHRNRTNQSEDPQMDDNKRRALSSALSQTEKQFGKGAVMRMGDRTSDAIDAIPTGSLALDIALGIGGL